MRTSAGTMTFLGIVMLYCLFGAQAREALCSESSDDLKAKQIVVEAKNIKNDNPEFLIKLWTDGKKKEYKVNDVVGFSFQANKDCYVTLLDIATDGTVYKIFPNKWHKSGKVEKNKVYTLPPKGGDFVFRVKGPEGMEYVKAIAALDPLKSVPDAKAAKEEPVSEIKDPGTVMKNISVELKKKETKDWTETLVSFKIAAAAPEKTPAPKEQPEPNKGGKVQQL